MISIFTIIGWATSLYYLNGESCTIRRINQIFLVTLRLNRIRYSKQWYYFLLYPLPPLLTLTPPLEGLKRWVSRQVKWVEGRKRRVSIGGIILMIVDVLLLIPHRWCIEFIILIL